MKTRYLYAPFGLKLTEPIKVDNIEDVLSLCLSLSDDPEFQKAVQVDSHEERLKNLKAMGFTIS